MKKIFAIAALLLATTISYGQHTTSRQVSNGVTDASVTSYKSVTVADTAGATKDSIQIRPNAQVNYYKVNLLDSAIINVKSFAGCYYGDVLIFDILVPAFTTPIILGDKFIVSTGTTTLSGTASKSIYLRFWFNGVDWVEGDRLLNYTR